MGLTAQFEDPKFAQALQRVRAVTAARGIACGVHVVAPEPATLSRHLAEGYRFIAYAIDAVFLDFAAARPVR